MKPGFLVLLGLLIAGSAFAQWTPPRTYGSPSGFGNILFPGTGTAPPLRSGAPSVPAGYYGRGGYQGARRISPVYGGGARTVVVPYAVPVYVNGSYDMSGIPPQEAYNPQPQAPAVIINQTFVPETAHPLVRDYMDSDLPPTPPRARRRAPVEPQDDEDDDTPAPAAAAREIAKPTIYLIAFKDHSIYSAIAYWVDEDTLNYITPNGVHNRATFDLVDENLSRDINGEKGIDFRLNRKAPAK
jgi:hypothetical protein